MVRAPRDRPVPVCPVACAWRTPPWQSCVTVCVVAVWSRLLGNPHNITAELYAIHLSRARAVLLELTACRPTPATMFDAVADPAAPAAGVGREHSMALIDLDVPRTFAGWAFFAPGAPDHDALYNILRVCVCVCRVSV